MLMATKGAGAVRALCTGMIARQPEAAWAHRRLALLDLQEAHEPGQLVRKGLLLSKGLRLSKNTLLEGSPIALWRAIAT